MRTGQGQGIITEANEVNEGGPELAAGDPAARPASSGETTDADDAHKTHGSAAVDQIDLPIPLTDRFQPTSECSP